MSPVKVGLLGLGVVGGGTWKVLTDNAEEIARRAGRRIEVVAVAVRDRFGRLAKNTILSYIEKCITSPNQIDRKTYGAGLGLYLVANAAASYVVNVAYGIATEVVCTFDRGAKSPLRLVGVFVHPGGADMLKQGPTPETAAGQGEGLDTFDRPVTAGDRDG